MSEYPPCPACESEEVCEPSCPISVPMNEMRNRKIRVYIDEVGDQFINASDIDKVVRSHIALTQAANGALNPMTQVICKAVVGFAGILMSATNPESTIRVLVSDIDTSVPDTVPTDWLNDAPGGQA